MFGDFEVFSHGDSQGFRGGCLMEGMVWMILTRADLPSWQSGFPGTEWAGFLLGFSFLFRFPLFSVLGCVMLVHKHNRGRGENIVFFNGFPMFFVER